MKEKWQLFDEQGRPLIGQGAADIEVLSKGLLHGAAHVCIWRRNQRGAEVLLHKHSILHQTWQNRYDIIATGHIDRGELPIEAAARETKAEIGIDIDEQQLSLQAVLRYHKVLDKNQIENEFRWLYLLELSSLADINSKKLEVDWLQWKPLNEFQTETVDNPEQYVPHGDAYFLAITSAIRSYLTKK